MGDGEKKKKSVGSRIKSAVKNTAEAQKSAAKSLIRGYSRVGEVTGVTNPAGQLLSGTLSAEERKDEKDYARSQQRVDPKDLKTHQLVDQDAPKKDPNLVPVRVKETVGMTKGSPGRRMQVQSPRIPEKFGLEAIDALKMVSKRREEAAGNVEDYKLDMAVAETEAAEDAAALTDQAAWETERDAANNGFKMRAALENIKAVRGSLDKFKVDPKRAWKNKSTGQKIAAMVGAFLVGLGGAMAKQPAMIQQYMGMLTNEVEQDVRAQEMEFNKLKEAGGLVKTEYALLRQIIGDANAARQLQFSLGMKKIRLELDHKLALIKDPLIKAQGLELRAAIQEKELKAMLGVREAMTPRVVDEQSMSERRPMPITRERTVMVPAELAIDIERARVELKDLVGYRNKHGITGAYIAQELFKKALGEKDLSTLHRLVLSGERTALKAFLEQKTLGRTPEERRRAQYIKSAMAIVLKAGGGKNITGNEYNIFDAGWDDKTNAAFLTGIGIMQTEYKAHHARMMAAFPQGMLLERQNLMKWGPALRAGTPKDFPADKLKPVDD